MSLPEPATGESESAMAWNIHRDGQRLRRHTLSHRNDAMKSEAQQALCEIRSLKRMNDCLGCARAELASDPHNDQLREFVELFERLVAQKKLRLCGASADSAAAQAHPETGFAAAH